MATCKWCGKKGLFFKVSPDGLCNTCTFLISGEAESFGRVIMESVDIIRKSNKPETISSRATLIKNYLNRFKKYEERGIQPFNFSTDDFINEISAESNERIVLIFYYEYFRKLSKIKNSKTDITKKKATENLKTKSNEFVSSLVPNLNQEICQSAIINATEKNELDEIIRIAKKVKGQELDQFDEITESFIVTIPSNDSCESCKDLSKKRFSLEDAKEILPLPHAGCTSEFGCRCCYSIEPKEDSYYAEICREINSMES
jgi:hypothetical protein